MSLGYGTAPIDNAICCILAHGCRYLGGAGFGFAFVVFTAGLIFTSVKSGKFLKENDETENVFTAHLSLS